MRIFVVVAFVGILAGCIADPSSMTFEGGQAGDVGSGVDVAADVGQTEDAITEEDSEEVFDGGLVDEDASEDADVIVEPLPMPKSCAEIRERLPVALSGPYLIAPIDGVEIEVYCDMHTDGGVGYTMVRLEDDALGANQDNYRAACEAIGMEVIVPRTRGHARSIARFNDGQAPNLVNVFPKTEGAQGLSNWEGRCQGQPCTFYLGDRDNANCTQHLEPNGDNSVNYALYAQDTALTDPEGQLCFGRWNDQHNHVQIRGHVICSPNDVGPTQRASCQDYVARDEVFNAGVDGISGLYPIGDAQGTFEVYCDMTTEGGGWTLIWKNTGDVTGANLRNNEALWNEVSNWAPGQPSAAVLPHHLESGSAVDYRAWHHFKELPHQTWTKFASLHYASDRSLRHRQSFHLHFGKNRFKDVLDNLTNCHVLEDYIEVFVNGTDSMGRTRHLIHQTNGVGDLSYVAYGLATTRSEAERPCDQPDSELIHDTSAYRILSSGSFVPPGDEHRTMTYVFSYAHNGTNRNRSRCMYNCWGNETGSNYDAFVWGVRGPLTYVSCDEVRRLDPSAPSGDYLVDEGNGPTATTCTF